MDINQKREKIVVKKVVPKARKVETEITGNDLDKIARTTLQEPRSKSRIAGVPAKGCKRDPVSAYEGSVGVEARQSSELKPICPEKSSSKRKAKSLIGEENVQEVNTVLEASGLQCTQGRVKQVKVEDDIEEVKTTLVTTKQNLPIKTDDGAWLTTSEPRTASQPGTEAPVTAVTSIGVGLTVPGQYTVLPSLPRGLSKEVLFADVTDHYLEVLRRVYTRERGTFAKAHQLGAAYLRMNLEFLGSLLVALDRRQVRDVTSDEIDVIQTNINGLKMVGFDLGWLERRLENVRVRKRLAAKEVHFAQAKLRMSEAEKALAAWKAEGVRLEAELRTRQAEVKRVEADLQAFPPTEGLGVDSGVLEGLL